MRKGIRFGILLWTALSVLCACAAGSGETRQSGETMQDTITIETEEELPVQEEVYYVRTAPDGAGLDAACEEQTFSTFADAAAYAAENRLYGSCVYAEDGTVLYAPDGYPAAQILYEAKRVCDYVRDEEFNYGDAPINPAFNHDAKLVSCDRLVDWVLYRIGFTDQPESHGMCVSGPGLTQWCADQGFEKIESVSDLRPGDIVFVREMRKGIPAHVFIHAGKGERSGMYYRYDCGKVERIRSTQPSCEVITDFMFAYRVNSLPDGKEQLSCRDFLNRYIEHHDWASLQEPCSGDDIKAAEETVGCKFPEELKAFLRETDGDHWLLLSAGEIIENVERNREILSTAFDDPAEYQKQVDSYLYFATNGCGDYYCYRIRSDHKVDDSVIYLWEHETFTCRPAASSIRELIDRYYRDEI